MVQAGGQRSQPKRQGTLSEFFGKVGLEDQQKGLESGSMGSKPDPRPQAASRAPEHADPAARKSDHDKPPGYGIRVLHAHGLPNSLAVSTVLHSGQGMEGHQGQHPGQVDQPSQGHTVPTCADNHCSTSGSTGECPGEAGECKEIGMVDRGWDQVCGDEMESQSENARDP